MIILYLTTFPNISGRSESSKPQIIAQVGLFIKVSKWLVIKNSNQGSFVDMLAKLVTLAVTQRLFGQVRILPNQQNFHLEQFHSHFQNYWLRRCIIWKFISWWWCRILFINNFNSSFEFFIFTRAYNTFKKLNFVGLSKVEWLLWFSPIHIGFSVH